ncbi:MAG: hypothetical protein RBS05_12475 [Zoogloea oleivorans]|jgi:hypothetical protein|uniref:hypothetical protein n=1 Tax=Zoogloea oleivorans TaxID=1552750 RepID=UPI002A35A4E5|nr:hypothetical protein [Zoogloea oleivorans]MDY0036716.1 hypothetical protein [Zoogloea oleivorans]
MSNLKIEVTVDQESMGEGWEDVERFCEMLAEALEGEYPEAVISVEPECSTLNGGCVYVDCEDFSEEEAVRNMVKYWSEGIYSDGEWIS